MDHAAPGQRLALSKKDSQSGFTFIEVTVALALLAVAASILIGMQGAAVKRTLRDISAQEAMLVARRIMASIELLKDSDASLPSQSSGSVRDLLQQLNITGIGEKPGSSAIDRMTASISVDELQIQMPYEEKLEQMKLVTLKLSWGPGSDEWIQLVYQRPPQ